MRSFSWNETAPAEIYTLSLHDALTISRDRQGPGGVPRPGRPVARRHARGAHLGAPARLPRRSPDRKSTRLNASHVAISYAVFCLKKKKTNMSCLSSCAQQMRAAAA